MGIVQPLRFVFLFFLFLNGCFGLKIQAGTNDGNGAIRQANKPKGSGGTAKQVTVTPEPSSTTLVNPGKGWVLYGSARNQPPEVLALASLGYTRYSWSAIEPEEGNYRWEIIDNDIKTWHDAGKQFAFGVMCASSHSSSFWTSPKWVFDAGAKYDTFELKDIKLNTTGTPGPKLVPVFDDPVFMEKLGRFIRALAARYDGHPDIAFIDIRSYGNWGEGHMYPFGKPDISAEKYKEHIQLHRNAFHKTLLQLPTGKKSEYIPVFDWAVSIGVGLRRDGICGNSNGDEVTGCAGKMAAVFEFYGDYQMMEKLGWWYGKKDDQGRGFTLESCIEKGMPTYCDLSRGGQSGLNLLKKEPELIQKLTNRLGYHFVITKAVFPKTFAAKKNNHVSITWENQGVTQIYIPAKVTYALLSAQGMVVELCDADSSLPGSWQSDKPVTAVDNLIFKQVKAGDYTLAVGIRQPNDRDKPSVKLGITMKNIGGWYELGSVKIK